MEKVYESFLLAEDEFSLLLQSTGGKGHYGFFVGREPYSRQEWINMFARMVRKEILISNGESFRIDAVLAEGIHAVCNAREMMLAEVNSGNIPVYCCYPGSDIWICEWMNRRKNHIKLKKIPKTLFFDVLMEEGFFPEYGEGKLEIHDNQSGKMQRRLTVKSEGLEKILFYEEDGKEYIEKYSLSILQVMFEKLLGGEFL